MRLSSTLKGLLRAVAFVVWVCALTANRGNELKDDTVADLNFKDSASSEFYPGEPPNVAEAAPGQALPSDERKRTPSPGIRASDSFSTSDPTPEAAAGTPFLSAEPVVSSIRPRDRATGDASPEGPAAAVVDVAVPPASESLPPATPQPSPIATASTPEATPAPVEPKPRATGDASSEGPAAAVVDVAAQPASESLPPATPQPSPIAAASPTSPGHLSTRSVPSLRASVPHFRLATRTAAGRARASAHAQLDRLSVTRGARKPAQFGRAGVVGTGAAGKGSRVTVSKAGTGSIGGPSSSSKRGGRDTETGKGIGISAASVASLHRSEGVQWRLTLKRRCPSILESSAEYDDEVVWLCRVSAGLN
jgi:hypothetical protein